jgi:hypothetical protein
MGAFFLIALGCSDLLRYLRSDDRKAAEEQLIKELERDQIMEKRRLDREKKYAKGK